VSWPELPASAYAGHCLAIEAELTPKPLAPTAAIMAGLLARTADYQPGAPPVPGLEGTREQSVAEAQAMALTELVANVATSPHGEPRVILLACDDYSAVSGRVPLWQLYERGRSLGVGVQVSAQSWQGLGRDDDERRRICATADGGIWLMRTPYPQPSANWPEPAR
jgi:hypothetical protein